MAAAPLARAVEQPARLIETCWTLPLFDGVRVQLRRTSCDPESAGTCCGGGPRPFNVLLRCRAQLPAGVAGRPSRVVLPWLVKNCRFEAGPITAVMWPVVGRDFLSPGVGGHGRSGGADLATVVAYVRGPETVGSWGIHHRQGASMLRLIPTRGPCRNSAISGAGSRRQPKADIAPLPMMLTGFPDSSRLAPKADPIFPGPQARRFSATFPRRRRASSWPAMTCPPRSSTADASPSGEHTRFTQRCMP